MTSGKPADERVRPTQADFKRFAHYESTVLERVLADARVWRNGYALLGTGIGALLTLVGTGLTETTHWGWRLTLTILLGLGLIAITRALWLTLTVEGGRRPTTLNLNEIVQQHNSFEMYLADQAATAVERLHQSRRYAIAAAGLCFLALIATLWISMPLPEPGPGGMPAANLSPTPSASVTASPSLSPAASASPTATP